MAKTGNKHHSLQQISRMLRVVDAQVSAGQTVVQACDAIHISPATYYLWNKNYGGMTPYQLRHLEDMNEAVTQLRRQIHQLSMDNTILTEALQVTGSVTRQKRREIARLIHKQLGISQRRVCAALAKSRPPQCDGR